MKYCQSRLGRVFIVRLEDGDIIHTCLEALAERENIQRATVFMVGGVDEGSTLIVGPEKSQARPVTPMEYVLDNVYEAAGVGTIFPNEQGKPILHMHMACGRKGSTRCGCIRSGVKTWQIGEVVVLELTGTGPARKKNPDTGFEMLEI